MRNLGERVSPAPLPKKKKKKKKKTPVAPRDMRQIAAYLGAAHAADILLTEDFNVCFFK